MFNILVAKKSRNRQKRKAGVEEIMKLFNNISQS